MLQRTAPRETRDLRSFGVCNEFGTGPGGVHVRGWGCGAEDEALDQAGL